MIGSDYRGFDEAGSAAECFPWNAFRLQLPIKDALACIDWDMLASQTQAYRRLTSFVLQDRRKRLEMPSAAGNRCVVHAF